MMNGTIISWDDAKGFGFIKPDNESKKVFLHVSAFEKHP
jgi:cold shock CspA family protein